MLFVCGKVIVTFTKHIIFTAVGLNFSFCTPCKKVGNRQCQDFLDPIQEILDPCPRNLGPPVQENLDGVQEILDPVQDILDFTNFIYCFM